MKPSIHQADVFEDRDPRMDGRRLVVLRVSKRFARVVSTTGRETVISIARLTNPRLFTPVPA